MSKPRILDLFCGAGGAGMGYARAGFEVVGVDIKPQPHYPFEFIQADVFEVLAGLQRASWIGGDVHYGGVSLGEEIVAIHASPPCQRYSHATASGAWKRHPDLVARTRSYLGATGAAWVIENVPRAPLDRPITLCGTMFGLTATDDDGTELHLKRHRLFESNLPLEAPGLCVHPKGVQWAGSYGGARRDKDEARNVRHGGYVPSKAVQGQLLGIDWMIERELYEAIPPAYAEHIGYQLMSALEARS